MDVMGGKSIPLSALIFFAINARCVMDRGRLPDVFLMMNLIFGDIDETYPELFKARAEATGCPACNKRQRTVCAILPEISPG
jgi:hypothetical protein